MQISPSSRCPEVAFVLRFVIVALAIAVHASQANPQGPRLVAPVDCVFSSARDIPISAKVDIVIVGGSEGGIAAAWQAAKSGSSVLIVNGNYFFRRRLRQGTLLARTG